MKLKYLIMMLLVSFLSSCRNAQDTGMTFVYCTPLEYNAYPLEIVIDGENILATYKGVNHPAKIDLKEIQRDSDQIVYEENLDGTVGGRYYWKKHHYYDGLFATGELTYKKSEKVVHYITEEFFPVFDGFTIDEAEDSIVSWTNENMEFTDFLYRWEYKELSVLLHENKETLYYPFNRLQRESPWSIITSENRLFRIYNCCYNLERHYYCSQIIVQYAVNNQVVTINQFEQALFEGIDLDYDPLWIDEIHIQQIQDEAGYAYLVEVTPQGCIMSKAGLPNVNLQESVLYLFKIENGILQKKKVMPNRRSISILYDRKEIQSPIFNYNGTDKILQIPEINQECHATGRVIKYKWNNGHFKEFD